jgi:putative ABC transport system permease protein
VRRLRTAVVPLPAQAVGLAGIVAVLSAAVVSVPLMVGAAEEGAWALQRAQYAETELAVSLTSTSFPESGPPPPTRIPAVAELDDRVSEAVADAGLSPPVFQTVLRLPWITPTTDGPARTQLLSRTGAEDHVRITAGAASSDGVLIPERLARATGLGPGDRLTSTSNAGRPATVTIAGIYVEPSVPLPAFWSEQRSLFLPVADPESDVAVQPPPVVLAPRDVAIAAAAAGDQDLNLTWSIPLERGIGVDEARAVLRRFDQLRGTVADPATPVPQFAEDQSFPTPLPESQLGVALRAVDDTRTRLIAPIQAVGAAGAVATVVVVGAWAAQRVRRREDEFRALLARGIGPGRLAARAAGEAVLPALLGVAVGAVGAWLLVHWAGPSDRLPAGTAAGARNSLAAGLLAVIVVVPLVTAALTSRIDQADTGPGGRRLTRVPWLAVATAVTVVTLVPLLTRGPERGRLDLLTLGVPLLACAVAAGALTALLPSLSRRTDVRLRRLPPAGSLAIRRTLLARGLSRLVVVTTALALGLVLYAGALGVSDERTIAAKGAVAAPSDVMVTLDRRTTPEANPPPPGTTVVGFQDSVVLSPGEQRADLLVVDAASFAGAVHWDDVLADRPLDDLLGALEDYRGDRVPALDTGSLAGTPTGEDQTLRAGRFSSMPLEIVGTALAFPGQPSPTPAVIVDWTRFGEVLAAQDRQPVRVLGRQVWGTGRPAQVLEALTAAGYAYDESRVTGAAAFTALPDVRAQAWSLAYLRAVSVAAGLLALVGVAMHALAQQRRRTVATVLLSRMGMRRRSTDAATALELGLLVGAAAVVAVLVALPSSALLLDGLDTVPDRPPAPLFTVPWGTLALVLAGVLVVAVGGALLAGRAARRVVPGEVLRDTA